MWEAGSILVKNYVSSGEFNEFLRQQKAIEGNKRLDPPNEDQIEFYFDQHGQHASTIVKMRDRDFSNCMISISEYGEETEKLDGNPRSWFEVAITTKHPNSEDYLNFYIMCEIVLSKWQGVLSDLDGSVKTKSDVSIKIQEITSGSIGCS